MSSNENTHAHDLREDCSLESLKISAGKSMPMCEEEAAWEAEVEAAAHMHYQAFNRHYTTCQKLWLNFKKVTPEHLIRATVTDDPDLQIERLNKIFDMLQIKGDAFETQRVDFIHRVAEYGPRNVNELQLIYMRECMRHLSIEHAGMIASLQGQPLAATQCIGGLAKLVHLDGTLSARIEASQRSEGPAPCELHGHMHIHAAGVTDKGQMLESQVMQPPIAALPAHLPRGITNSSIQAGMNTGWQKQLGYDLL